MYERHDNVNVDAVLAKKRKHLAKVPPTYREVVHVRLSTQQQIDQPERDLRMQVQIQMVQAKVQPCKRHKRLRN